MTEHADGKNHLTKSLLRWLLGVAMIAAGLNHFRVPEFYANIMPPYLPWHLELVYLSGIGEVVLGALLLVPRYSITAAWGLIALLIAVFPANLHMAVNAERYPHFAPIVLWLRLPFQAVFIAWAYWFTRRSGKAEETTKYTKEDENTRG